MCMKKSLITLACDPQCETCTGTSANCDKCKNLSERTNLPSCDQCSVGYFLLSSTTI
jgi:hypothetical protein